MTISMSSASLPVFKTMLANLSHILDKGAAHAEARKFDPAVLLQFRLAPDMLPFTRQILIACDAAKNGVARLSGVEAPKFDDTEATFPELKARIQKTLDYLASVPAERVDGTRGQGDHLPGRPRQDAHHEGRGLPEALGAAELPLPRHDGVRHPAPQRRGAGQVRLPRPARARGPEAPGQPAAPRARPGGRVRRRRRPCGRT